MRPEPKHKYADDICTQCYHRMNFVRRVPRNDWKEHKTVWMIVRKCPQCGYMNAHRDPDQSAKEQES